MAEPILAENKDRFVIFPIKHNDIWEYYKKSEASFWTCPTSLGIAIWFSTDWGDPSSPEFCKKAFASHTTLESLRRYAPCSSVQSLQSVNKTENCRDW